MQKMLASLVALTSFAAAPVFADATQGYYSSLHPQSVSSKIKAAVTGQGTDIVVGNATNVVITNQVYVNGNPNPVLNDYVNPNTIDHIYNGVAMYTNVVLRDPNGYVIFPNPPRLVCPYANIVVRGTYGNFSTSVFPDNC